jgi:hypothetical protein
MNHSESNGEYPELNWSGFRISSKLWFDALITGLLTGGLIGGGLLGRLLVFFAVMIIWKHLESRLDRIESKLSN